MFEAILKIYIEKKLIEKRKDKESWPVEHAY